MEQGLDYLYAPGMRVTNEDGPLLYAADLAKLALVDRARIIKAVHRG